MSTINGVHLFLVSNTFFTLLIAGHSRTHETKRYQANPVYNVSCWTPMHLNHEGVLQQGCTIVNNSQDTSNECHWQRTDCVVDTKVLSSLDRAYCIQSILVDFINNSYTIQLEGASCFRSSFLLAVEGDCKPSKCTVDSKYGVSQRLSCCCMKSGCNRNFYVNIVNASGGTARSFRTQTILYPLLAILLFSTIATFVLLRNRSVRLFGKRSKLANESGIAAEEKHLLNPSTISISELCFKEIRARGKFGRIYRAIRKDDDYQEYAVKVFSPNEYSSFENEKRIYNMLRTDPNYESYIIKFFMTDTCSITKDHIEYCIVTQFYVYGSVFDYLSLKKHITADNLVKIAQSMTDGLAYLHENNKYKLPIAHRDFKSQNVILTDNINARIADFGLAQELTKHLGEMHSPVGTPRYMAPEVLEGAISFNPNAFLCIDVYAYALVLYELCACCVDLVDSSELREYHLPFDFVGANPSTGDMKPIVIDKQLRPSLPSSFTKTSKMGLLLSQTINDCWDQDPDSRLSIASAKFRLRNLSHQP
ncbi:hypothetical protein GJ496_003380 [Pomphorhynchus laevis]|nr:hypothetical protein GJ496_003380 [Pomphorhynchus laevis]